MEVHLLLARENKLLAASFREASWMFLPGSPRHPRWLPVVWVIWKMVLLFAFRRGAGKSWEEEERSQTPRF
jgi:hypothetical protein